MVYDSESRLREVRLDIPNVNQTDRENLAYGAPAEVSPSLPPFLASAIAKDRPRRNYYINARGRAVFYDPANPPSPLPQTERLYDVPTSRVSFGSNTLPGMLGYQNLGTSTFSRSR